MALRAVKGYHQHEKRHAISLAYGLGSQSSAAHATALTIPLHANASPFDPAEIELLMPTFATRAMCPGPTSIPTDFNLIGYLMTLSLCLWVMGPALWSVFWDPDVPCNFAGARVLPSCCHSLDSPST